MSALCDTPRYVMPGFPRRRARGPPARPRLRSAKDRAATRSSRTSTPSAPNKNPRSVYPGGGRTCRRQAASAAFAAGRGSSRAPPVRALAMALSHEITPAEAHPFHRSLVSRGESG